MLNLLEVIEPNTIDSVVTDPPYELNFMNKGWDRSGIAFQKETWDKCYQALKPGGYLLAFGGSRTFHRIAVAIEDAGFEIRDVIMLVYGSGFPKSHNVGLAIDKLNGVESKVITKVKGSGTTGINERGNQQFVAKNQYDDGTYDLKQAQNEWQGWGTALKPSYEPIIVARKPLKGTVAQNVMQYGVGCINIDECRVETSDDISGISSKTSIWGDGDSKQVESNGNLSGGRFPANFIHNGSDEVVELFPNSDGGEDSASRFFYTAKASKKDRDEGLNLFDEQSMTLLQGRKLGSAGAVMKDGKQNPYASSTTIKRNVHPTVKPCELMQYLVRLVTPKNGTVLDPFMGSGSTGKATMFENREREANYKFIGIDLDLDNQYCEIANARIDYALNKFKYDELEIREKDKEEGKLSIFDFMGDEQ